MPRDPDDDKFIECAVAAGSRYIVSGDGDLLSLDRFEGIRIIRVAELHADDRPVIDTHDRFTKPEAW